MPRGSQIDPGAGGLEGIRLRPNFIFSRRQRRKIVIALLIGKDARGDGAPYRFGGDGHSAHFFTGI